jgi:hypothetical protein
MCISLPPPAPSSLLSFPPRHLSNNASSVILIDSPAAAWTSHAQGTHLLEKSTTGKPRIMSCPVLPSYLISHSLAYSTLPYCYPALLLPSPVLSFTTTSCPPDPHDFNSLHIVSLTMTGQSPSCAVLHCVVMCCVP